MLIWCSKCSTLESPERQNFTHVKHQNTQTSLYKLSKNHWVIAFFEIFGSVRRKYNPQSLWITLYLVDWKYSTPFWGLACKLSVLSNWRCTTGWAVARFAPKPEEGGIWIKSEFNYTLRQPCKLSMGELRSWTLLASGPGTRSQLIYWKWTNSPRAFNWN